jgi:hypothetical protein
MAYNKTSRVGGNGGNSFSDDLTEMCDLIRVKVRHGKKIDAITSVWRTTAGNELQGTQHGGGGGEQSAFTLAEGEFINRIEGRSGDEIDQLTFFTNQGHKYGPYGGNGGSPFTLADLKVGGFWGRSEERLDAFGAFTVAAC